MKNRDEALLKRIYDYCIDVEDTINLFGDENVLKINKIYCNAVCMPIMQIGELCKLISDETKNTNAHIDWKGWSGVRDILAHQYTNLDYEKIWNAITKDLPILKDELKTILNAYEIKGIERINKVLKDAELDMVDAKNIYHKIVDNTGVSLSIFSDEKIIEFVKEIIK